MLCLEAHAKINWTLDILGKRQDGYHLMDMLMQTISLSDTLWLEPADGLTLADAAADKDASARKAPGSADALESAAVRYDQSNLVYRAARLLKERYHVRQGARMRLAKRIPSGAGLGGGSADAAAALLGLNELWRLHLPRQALLEAGLSLGADIPFLLTGGLARVGGIGEAITPLSPAPRLWLLLIQPCGGLSTREVFAAFDPLPAGALARPNPDAAQAALLSHDPPALASAMQNVLEGVSLRARPALLEASAALESSGALRAMMTGSGSVVYGLYKDQAHALQALAPMQRQAERLGWGRVWLAHTLP